MRKSNIFWIIFLSFIFSSCNDSNNIPYHINEIEFLNGNIRVISFSSKSWHTDSTNYYYSKNHELEKILIFSNRKVITTYCKHWLDPNKNSIYFGTLDRDSLFDGYTIVKRNINNLPEIYDSYYHGKKMARTKFNYGNNKILGKEDFTLKDSTERIFNYIYKSNILVKKECNTGIHKVFSDYEFDHLRNPVSWKEGYYDGNKLKGNLTQVHRKYTYY
ncbi:hypothetical protein MY04_4410 [Flammeovirga sp. MY04]|uniref:hypothetical protein n=1 Tax=Flammeovirga sp. MY04 TaxID=1191459 RepID=UPI0008063DC6|nr:hypothetical protein [Flammeovirga sp. MY04]ANQ51748.1 hypothetical protein MY04_4410 [Flammeovirga sp. MY04]